jgi:hypothetical protein
MKHIERKENNQSHTSISNRKKLTLNAPSPFAGFLGRGREAGRMAWRGSRREDEASLPASSVRAPAARTPGHNRGRPHEGGAARRVPQPTSRFLLLPRAVVRRLDLDLLAPPLRFAELGAPDGGGSGTLEPRGRPPPPPAQCRPSRAIGGRGEPGIGEERRRADWARPRSRVLLPHAYRRKKVTLTSRRGCL